MIKEMSKRKKWLIELCATFFYVGYTPYAPGTVASLVTTVIWFLLPPCSWPILLMTLLVMAVIGVWISTCFEQCLRRKDPSCIVIDEVFGMSIALAMLPQVIWLYVFTFLFFRFFDITKIFPVYCAEKYLQEGWAVMSDDFVAGLMARGCIALLMIVA
jgi:phosphatidylglycerophosphatase A